MKKIFLLICFLFFLSGCQSATRTVFITEDQKESSINVTDTLKTIDNSTSISLDKNDKKINNNLSDNQSITTTPSNHLDKKKVEIPIKVEWPVSFAQQAPFANWDQVHEEACEEASMIMVAKYFYKQALSETIMEQELQKLLKWEAENNYQVDLTAREVVEILKDYFGLTAIISEEITVDKIKYELSQGNLIIVPAAGRQLRNPNFKQPGPIYHMLVIKGYNDREFITNDPGTRKGNSYKYSQEILLNAIHDWDPQLAQGGMTEKEMEQGIKRIIIVKSQLK